MKRLVLLLLALVILVGTAFAAARALRLQHEETARKEAAAREIAVLERAAEAGDPVSQIALADRLRRADPPDPAAAVSWYRKAAQRGALAAAAALGEMYETGDGVPQDYHRAADWYRVAVSFGGPPRAFLALGRMHLYGRGVLHDPLEGFTLVRTAAERGEPAAQTLLAMMYDRGWGTEADRVEAYKWLLVASRRDGGTAADRTERERLSGRLNSQQIREAETRAERWASR